MHINGTVRGGPANTSSLLAELLADELEALKKLDIMAGGLCFCGLLLTLGLVFFLRLKRLYAEMERRTRTGWRRGGDAGGGDSGDQVLAVEEEEEREKRLSRELRL